MTTDYSYEKLSLMYLGKEIDFHTQQKSDTPFLLKNKDLTTHAVIIGMTGSGKTGLGVGIIEEAMMDNIPSIVIDPKGDMGNLMLRFPELRPADFQEWIDPAEAARKEMEPAAYAEKMARTWKEGLASWQQSPERIKTLRQKAECVIYTPGSTSGVPVSVLNSFDAPGEDVMRDLDTVNSMVGSAVTSLLTLVGIKSDNLQSREYILLSSILLQSWRKGENLSLESLIAKVVDPPFDKVGVFSLDTFFKQSERMELAMSLNNVLASPTFSSWITGEPLDIQRILYTPEGKPKTAIFSISHLSESERMFFVTMLLNQFVGWMRRQQGSASLKALLYMDEIFGYFPPTANPPSKKPMLLLLKQARAYGVGVILATQNPVDLDYKGLSNIGSWFIGRLQTAQDQEKVLDGVVGASDGQLDRAQVRQLLGDMKGRQFVLNSAHLELPVLFETRWVMSYLKGPMSLLDITKLMDGYTFEAEESVNNTLLSTTGGDLLPHPPIISEKLEQRFALMPILTEQIFFEPWLGATSMVRFYNQKRNIDEVKEVRLRLCLDNDTDTFHWERAETLDLPLDDFDLNGPEQSSYSSLPDSVMSLNDFRPVEKDLADYLYQYERLELYRAEKAKLESVPGESLADFTVRLGDYLREQKEESVEKLQDKFKVKQDRIEKQIETALNKVEKEKADVRAKTTDTILSFGSAILGAFLGRKTVSVGSISKAATGIKNVGRVGKEKDEVTRAEEKLAGLEEDLIELSRELEQQVAELSDAYSPENFEIETFAIKPRRSDIFDLQVCLLWVMVPPMQE